MTSATGGEPLLRRLFAEAPPGGLDTGAITMQRSIRTRYVVDEVCVHDEPRFIIKTARTPDVVPMLKIEGQVLAWLDDASPDPRAPRVQRPSEDTIIWHEPGEHARLVTTHLGAACDWNRDPLAATRLGEALAIVHRSRGSAELPASSIPSLLLPRLQEAAGADEGTARAFDYLVRRWVSGTVIHGDVKWEHVRCASAPAFIDWELGGAGDPAWDVASLLHELVMLDAPGDALRECLVAYGAGVRRTLSGAFLLRCAAALSTRFVQSREEYACGGASPVTVDLAHAQARWWAAHPHELSSCLGVAA